MKKTILCAIGSLIFMQSNIVYSQDNQTQVANVSKKISSLVKKLGSGVNEVSPDWKSNPEAVEILSYSDMKKSAATNSMIWQIKSNEEKLFPRADKDKNQLAVMLISRLISYGDLRQLVASSEEFVVRDFLDGEIADLRLTLDNRLPYEMYLKERKRREDKITYMLSSNKDFTAELLNVKLKDTAIVRLANKTSAMALMNACVQNMNLCEKI